MLTLSELQRVLEIDMTSPSGLRWLERSTPASRINKGDVAGCLTGLGKYYNLKIFNKSYKWHRIIYVLHNKLNLDELPEFIDHKDGCKTNNSPDNLRAASKSDNSVNTLKRKSKSPKSEYKGVGFKDGLWVSRIRYGGKRNYLGGFKTEKEAGEAYKEASLKYHGEFSPFHNLNTLPVE